jgi:DNA-binding NtrC family response regulator
METTLEELVRTGSVGALFDDLPTPVWIIDWSPVRDELGRLGVSDTDDLDRVLAADPGLAMRLARSTVFRAANQATFALMQIPSLDEANRLLPAYIGSMPTQTIDAMLRAFVQGDTSLTTVLETVRPDGKQVAYMVHWLRPPSLHGSPLGLVVSLDRTVEYAQRRELDRLRARLAEENVALRAELRSDRAAAEIIGDSDEMQRVVAAIRRVGPTDATVLICGETGTGKELVADAIHAVSRRHEQPIIKMNCAAMSAALVESELFGHEKGAFTGAHERRKGRFELADGSSLFLDEIGELPLESQAKLLRVLQEGTFEPVGSSKTMKVDVRIIAATNRDLQAEVDAGRFRADLFYRLNVFPIELPPLRARPEDIPKLTHHFIAQLGPRVGRAITGLSREAMELLAGHDWPGNVRELANLIERAMIVATGDQITVDDLPSLEGAPPRTTRSPSQSLDDVLREHIIAVLEQTDWAIGGDRGAARILGMNESTLRSRMKKLGIRRDHGSRDDR